ncbi:MAG TPA: FkbM family methyltransferase [Candidatus Latescibacteria bacterium]|nr:FkbM family methyltransferase [Candidatus Latescibacterota bacterium]HPK75567.1 FkbM family methyltransferase [Candidatus Latescibacterota bacterium]
MDVGNLFRIIRKIVSHPVTALRRLHFRFRHRWLAPHDFNVSVDNCSLTLRSDSVLAETLVSGEFERDERTLLCSLARPGMVVFDIGANIGMYSVLWGKCVGESGHVYAFEPFAPTAEYLRRNILANELVNVTVVQKAAADKEGIWDFRVSGDGRDVYNSLADGSGPEERLERVPVTTLDAFCAGSGVRRIDLLKVDVEGAEELVLRGAERIIRCSPSICILAEINEPNSPSSRRLFLMLAGWGFSGFRISRGGSLTKCDGEGFLRGNAFFRRV